MERSDVRFWLGKAGGRVAPVTVGAAEHHVPADMHAGILDGGVTLKAARAFAGRFLQGLIDPVSQGQGMRRLRQIMRDGNWRTKTFVSRERGKYRAHEHRRDQRE